MYQNYLSFRKEGSVCPMQLTNHPETRGGIQEKIIKWDVKAHSFSSNLHPLNEWIFIHSSGVHLNKMNGSHLSFFSVIVLWSERINLLLTKLWLGYWRFTRGVLLPGARDWALVTGIRQHFNTTGSQISLLSVSVLYPLVCSVILISFQWIKIYHY